MRNENLLLTTKLKMNTFDERLRNKMLEDCNDEDMIRRINKLFDPPVVEQKPPVFDVCASVSKNFSISAKDTTEKSFLEQLKTNVLKDCNGDEDAINRTNAFFEPMPESTKEEDVMTEEEFNEIIKTIPRSRKFLEEALETLEKLDKYLNSKH
jgi:hypothetical protein